jgi:hypothetical protein
MVSMANTCRPPFAYCKWKIVKKLVKTMSHKSAIATCIYCSAMALKEEVVKFKTKINFLLS